MFRFTIRDVLWLTVVMAVVVSRYSDRLEIARAMAKTHAERAAETSALNKKMAELNREKESYFSLAREAVGVLKAARNKDAKTPQTPQPVNVHRWTTTR